MSTRVFDRRAAAPVFSPPVIHAPNLLDRIDCAIDVGLGFFQKKHAAILDGQSIPPELRDDHDVTAMDLKGEIRARSEKAFALCSTGIPEAVVMQQCGFAAENLSETAATLAAVHPRVAGLVLDLYPFVLPHIIQGYDESPVHHISEVVRHAGLIAVGESLNEADTALLVVAALIHDAGIGPAVYPKIGESRVAAASGDVQAKLRKLGIASRLEHMVLGAEMVDPIFEACIAAGTQYRDILESIRVEVRRLVAEHDYCKIPLLEPDAAKHTAWLLRKDDRIGHFLWQADAGWMLTPRGIRIDIARANKLSTIEVETDPRNSVEARINRFAFNIRLHRDVVSLYRGALSQSEFDAYVFPPEGFLYRSATGYRLAQDYQKALIRTDGSDFLYTNYKGQAPKWHDALRSVAEGATGPLIRSAAINLLGLIGTASDEAEFIRGFEKAQDRDIANAAQTALINLCAA